MENVFVQMVKKKLNEIVLIKKKKIKKIKIKVAKEDSQKMENVFVEKVKRK